MAILEFKRRRQAEEYMRGELSDGTTLSRLILKAVDFSRGKFFLLMPESMANADVDLKHETFPLANDEEIGFARVVKNFVCLPGCGVLLQDANARLSDPWIENYLYRRFAIVYGDEIYWQIAGPEGNQLSDEEMLRVIWSASYKPFCGFFYVDRAAPAGTALTESDLKRVQEALVGIAVGAFDDRSFLLWWCEDMITFPAEVQLAP